MRIALSCCGVLADAEKSHAELWAQRIRDIGGTEPAYRADIADEGRPPGQALVAVRTLSFAGLRLRKAATLPATASSSGNWEMPQASRFWRRVIEEEREHYRSLGELIEYGPPIPDMTPGTGQTGAR